MIFITYENKWNPHVTIHRIGCKQIKKRGGMHKYNQGKYEQHTSFEGALQYAKSLELPVVLCSFCKPPK